MAQQTLSKMETAQTAQTAVEWLVKQLRMQTQLYTKEQLIEQANEMFEEQIKHAIMYALDEDGHTGDWKIKFANDYITKYYPSNEAESTPNDL